MRPFALVRQMPESLLAERPLQSPAPSAPAWLDRSLYPFTSRYFHSADGRMHFVDEGSGPPIVMVHGTPTWSFLYRHLIARLARRHRVIAVDHLGFGLSDKPPKAPYAPSDHAARLVALLDVLDVSGATFVVHDFGGPIGLGAALQRLERVERLVLFNTWMWSLSDDPTIVRGARLLGGRLGQLLYRRFGFAVNVMMPMAVGDRRVLTPAIRRHYAAPLATPNDRSATWACARALLGSSDWFDGLWEQRERCGASQCCCCGDEGSNVRRVLSRAVATGIPEAHAHTFETSGHFVPEEVPAEIVPIIEQFIPVA